MARSRTALTPTRRDAEVLAEVARVHTDPAIGHASADPAIGRASAMLTRLLDASALASIGSIGDNYDNALAESVIGFRKTECMCHEGPWRGVDDLELGTLSWMHWFQRNPAVQQHRQGFTS